MNMTLREFVLRAAEILPIYESKLEPKQDIKQESEFETAQVPENGRIRLTKAGGKLIEWRIKE